MALIQYATRSTLAVFRASSSLDQEAADIQPLFARRRDRHFMRGTETPEQLHPRAPLAV
jgi:hypothetical protein